MGSLGWPPACSPEPNNHGKHGKSADTGMRSTIAATRANQRRTVGCAQRQTSWCVRDAATSWCLSCDHDRGHIQNQAGIPHMHVHVTGNSRLGPVRSRRNESRQADHCAGRHTREWIQAVSGAAWTTRNQITTKLLNRKQYHGRQTMHSHTAQRGCDCVLLRWAVHRMLYPSVSDPRYCAWHL